MMPIGPAPVMSTSSPRTWKRQGRVHGVAERIEDRLRRRDRWPGSVMPDIGHRQGKIFGEGARPIDADALGVLAQDAGGRPGNCGIGRRRRALRR